MPQHGETLEWIDQQQQRMADTLVMWSRINSGTANLGGLAEQLNAIEAVAEVLGGSHERIALPPRVMIDERGCVAEQPLGKALRIIKRPNAPHRMFLGIHMDTVYGVQHPFQETTLLDDDRLRGPGVADAKGGIVVLLTALEALERSPLASNLGWEILLNSDEEIGSPGSAHLFAEAATRCDLGMVYEPALRDGNLIGQRKGSGNFTIVVRGRSAHAGREFDMGRSAMYAIAQAISALNALNGKHEGQTVNVGKIDGGGPVNMVPDLAIARLNIRVADSIQQQFAEEQLRQIVADMNCRDGLKSELHGYFAAPPKILTPALLQYLNSIRDIGKELGLDLSWQSSGGVCDGNRLAAAGLPVVDTLGVVGGNIHSPDEYMLLSSLSQRAKLSALLLLNLASGDVDWPIREK